LLDKDIKLKETWNIEDVLLGYGISKSHKILFLGKKYIDLCIKLNKLEFRKLYLLDSDRNIYNNPYYTSIRYVYQKDMEMHFPPYFFNVIIVNHSDYDERLRDFVVDRGIIIVGLNSVDSSVEELNNIRRIKIAETHHYYQKNTKFKKIRNIGSEQNFQVINIDNYSQNRSPLRELDIMCYSTKEEGIYIHSKILKDRLESEYGILANIINSPSMVQSTTVIAEFHSNSGQSDRLIQDIKLLQGQNKRVILENHGTLKDVVHSLKALIDEGLIVTYRSPEIAEFDGIQRYTILPVLTYKNIKPVNHTEIEGAKIGSFGFIGKQKGIGDIISLALKLEIPATLLLGLSPAELNIEKKISNLIKKFGNKKNICIKVFDKFLRTDKSCLVQVSIGYHSDEEIITKMSMCSHIVFAHRTRFEESGTIKYAKRLLKPIFALDSYQARIGQVRRFSKFTRMTPLSLFWEAVIEEGLSVMRGKKNLRQSLDAIFLSLTSQSKAFMVGDIPSKGVLEKMKSGGIRDEDGLDYIVSIILGTKDHVLKLQD